MAKSYNSIKAGWHNPNTTDVNGFKTNQKRKKYEDIKVSDYDFSPIKKDLESTIRFDSFNEDLSSLGKSITDAYNGWQTPETMKNTLSSIEGMQGRLKAYDEYRRLFGGKDAPNLTDLSKGYTKAVDNWGTLAEEYGRYQNADSYRRETDTLKKLASMTSKDIEPYLTQKQEGKPTFEGPEYEPEDKESDLFGGSLGKTIDHYDEDGNPVYLKDAQKHRASAGRSMALKDTPVAYTTVDGQNITWQQLYDKKKKQEEHDALYKEVSSNADFKKYKSVAENVDNPTYEEADGKDYGMFGDYGTAPANPVKYSFDNKTMLGLSEGNGNASNYGKFNYTYLNKEEQDIYNFYLGQELEGVVEKGTAQKYLDSLAGELKDRHEGNVVEGLKSYANEHPILGSAISVGQNLMSGVEWLGDSAKYVFTGEHDDNFMARSSSAIRGTVSNNIDSDVGKFFYNTGMSMADSAVASFIPGGALLLGGSAAAQATNDALDRGMTHGQAFATGLASGVFETLFESVSIGRFKSLMDAPVDGVKSAIKNIGKSILVNATEETLTELANVAYDHFANADLSQMETSYRAYVNGGMSEEDAKSKVIWETAQRVGEAGLSGALMGLGFGAGGNAIAGMKNRATGKAISGNNRTSEMLNLAENSPYYSDVYKAYTEYANRGINADNITNTQLGALHNRATTEAMKTIKSKKSTPIETESAQNTLRDLTAFTQESLGQRIDTKAYTPDEQKDLVDEVIKKSGEGSEAHKLATEYKAKLDSGKKLTKKEISRLVEVDEAIVRPESKAELEKALTDFGETGDVAKIADAIYRQQTGEILTTAELDTIKDSDYGKYIMKGISPSEVVTTKESMDFSDKVMTEGESKLFTELYDGKVDIEDFRKSFNLMTEYAKHNYSQDTMLEHKGVLTEAQVSAIYKSTIMAKIEAQKEKIAKAHEKMGAKMSYKGFIDDSVINYSDKRFEGKVRWKDLNTRQRKAITFVKGIAKATGMNLVLTNKGLKEGYNGFYVDSNNTIVLDIDAGIDVAKGKLEDTIIPTVSHELTHWMKNKAPEMYRKMDELIFKTLGKDGISEEERVLTEVANLKKALKRAGMDDTNVTEEQARDEIIARACEDMLKMSEEGKKLFNSLSEVEQKNLMRKIKDFLYDLKEWITDLLSSYKSNSPEAQKLREYEEALNEISKMWDAMFAEAVKNNQALELSGEFRHGDVAVEDITSIGATELSDLAKAENVDGKKIFQFRAMETDKDIYREMLLKHKDTIGITDNQITDLFNMIDKAVDIISDNLEVLDYAWDADINERGFVPVKPNSDSLYKVSLDFSTLCRKRLLQQSIQALLQKTLDKQLSTKEAIAIRDELLKIQEEGRHIEVACALCYVESARMKSPKQITKFLNNRESIIREFFANRSGGSIKEKIEKAEMKARENLKKANPDGLVGKNGVVLDALTAPKNRMLKADADYIRGEGKKAKASYKLTSHEQAELDLALKMNVDDFTSAKGLENLAKHHRDLFDAYTSFVRNATHSKGIENDTWWRAGDSDLIGDNLIAQMNAENGLRSQSWSDFQVIHLLDYIAATIELSTKGAKRQSYTKVPDYVKLLGNTGDMINISLIPERVFNGKLSYDSVEGMAYDIAKQLRDEYHKTVGTICIGINDEQIWMLLADATIDMVIPYHHSGMSKETRKLMHIPSWITYEKSQSEKKLSDADAKAQAKEYGVELEKDSKNYGKSPKFSEWFNLEEARQIAKMENANPSDAKAQKKYGVMYGGYKAMQYAADNYLKLCAERGLAPKFSNQGVDFTKEANYWKLLIDRKMVDNVTGEVIEQEAIKPIFNEAHILEILNDELARYPQVKADQEYATRKVTEKFLSGEMKVDDSTLEAIQKSVDNITEVNILEGKKQFDLRDSDYMDAVNRGDMATAQKMVDEAAKEAGYTIRAYHGTDDEFNTFSRNRIKSNTGKSFYGNGFYFSTRESDASNYGGIVKGVYLRVNNALDLDGDTWTYELGLEGKREVVEVEKTSIEQTHNGFINVHYTTKDDPSNWKSFSNVSPMQLTGDETGKTFVERELNKSSSILPRDVKNLSELAKQKGFDAIKGAGTNIGDLGTEYVVFSENQIKSADPVTYDDDGNVIPLSKRFNTESNDIRYDLRDYSYDTLISKPDMKLTVLSGSVPNNRADIINQAKKNAEKVGTVNTSKSGTTVSVFVDDIGKDVMVGTDGLKHSLNRGKDIENKPLSFATLKIGEILKNSIRINELTPSKESATGAYVLIGAAKSVNGDLYIVRSVVNEYSNELASIDVLYAVNTKKEPAVLNAPRYAAKPLSVTDSAISIADLLDYVNKYFPDILPESVLKHYGYYARPEGELGEDALFSLRGQESAHDILGETERLRKENEMLRKDFEALQERLKLEKQVTNGNYFNEKQLGMVAGHLRNISRSNYSKDELIEQLKDAYSYIAQKGEYADLEAITFDEFYEKAYGIAVNILNEAKPEVEVNDYAKHLLGEIRRTRISLSATQKAEAEYRFGKNYHRMFFGNAVIANDGISLDSKWKEWSRQYPDFFDAEATESDQITALYDAIGKLKDASEVLVEYNTAEQARWLATEIYNKYWTVSPIETTADKYDKKIKMLNLEHRNRITELRDAYNERLKEQHKSDRAKFLEQAKKIREHRDMKIAEAKAQGRERLSQYRENAERKTRIQRITQNALTLNEWLVKNSKEKHIHESLKGPVVALLNALDFSSRKLLDKGVPTKKDISLSEALSDVREMMLDANRGEGENVDTLGTALAGYDFTEDMKILVNSVRQISKTFGDNEYVLNNMSLEELETLDKIVRVIKHSVSKMNKLHAAKFYAGVVELSEQSEKELKAREKVVKDQKKHFDKLKMKSLWNNTTPYYAFKRFGPAAQAIFQAMQDGQDKLAFLAKEVIDFTEKTYTKKELKEWTKKYYEFEIAQPDGTTSKFSLNLPQIMSLYCLVKQEDARRHILYGNAEGNGGGITIVETKETDAVRTNILLTEVDLNSILAKLNENKRAKEVADKLQEYMGARGAELGNEITMARWGINSFGIKDYFPIKVSSDTIGNKDDTIGVEGNSLVKLLNMSFTKARNKFASNSVEIGDIFDVFSSHMSDMMRYNSFALPILDMYKWMNYRGKDGFGKEHSVSKSIKDAFGDDAWNYVRKFMEDTNGSSKSQRRDNLAIKFFKNAKIAKVASSISTILLQPTSYIRAGAVMDNKYLIRALGHKPKVNHAKKYCGIALWKSLGYYDTDITRGLTEKIKHDSSVKDNITEASLYGVAKADEVTWGYLWNACELEVRDKQPRLKPGTKEFFDAVGLRLRDIVYATQVVDSTMTRSNLMRGTDGIDKFITTFASEPTLALNMVNDVFISAKLAKRMGEKVDKKHIRKTITAYTVTNIVAAVVQTMISAFRDVDDDKEEDYYWWLMLQNIGLNTSFLNKLPWINQMFSALQGFDSKRMDTEWMDKAVKSGKEVLKLMEGKGSVEKLIRYGLGSLSDATGIAGYNLYRDIMATIDLFTDVSGKED